MIKRISKKDKVFERLNCDKLAEKLIDSFSVKLFEKQMTEELNEKEADNIMFLFERKIRNASSQELLDEADILGIDIYDFFESEENLDDLNWDKNSEI